MQGRKGIAGIYRALFCTLVIAVGWLAIAPESRAQDIEPRLYSNTPVGVNFLITGYTYTQGGVAFDSVVAGLQAEA